MALSKKVLLIVGVFAAAAIIVVAAASLDGKERDVVDVNDSSDDEGNVETIDVTENTTVHQAANSQMSIVINEIMVVNLSESSPLEIYADPSEGNQYVILNVSVTNNLEEGLSITSENWRLHTSDELVNTITTNLASELPEEIPAGSTATFHMPFEIVAGATITMLEYQGMESLSVEWS
jgi:hypothetical protein